MARGRLASKLGGRHPWLLACALLTLASVPTEALPEEQAPGAAAQALPAEGTATAQERAAADQAAPAEDHAPVENGATAADGDPRQAAAASYDVQVGDFDADGTFTPRPGLAVAIVPMRPNAEGEVELGEPVTATTDGRGGVAIPPELPPGAVLLRFAGEQGGAVATLEARQARIGRYQRLLNDDDVEAEVRIQAEVGDSGLRVWQLLILHTAQPGVRRWTKQAPLRLPILAPAVGEVVLDRGLWPDNVRSAKVSVQGEGEAAFRGGQLELHGAVAPGRPLTVRVALPIAVPHATSALRLGLRGVVGRTRLTMALQASEPAAPRLQSLRPARLGSHREGRQRLVGVALLQPLRRDEVAIFEVSDLPSPATTPRRSLGGFAAVALLFGLAMLLRPRPGAVEAPTGSRGG